MATLETKYSVGDTVYYATTTQTRKQHPCPDCKGERKWKAISPAGAEYEFSCPRCASGYRSERELSLEYTAYAPVASKMTVGSIKVDTKPYSGRSGIEYMCLETGVGSGSIYDQNRLFHTEEEALEAAQLIANEQDKGEWVATLYNRTLEVSDYQLENGRMKLAEEAKSRASSMLWSLGYLFDQIEEAEGKDEILEHVQYYREYDWQRDKDKIASQPLPSKGDGE
ncbi:MAG TPA: hypothetical protein VN155_16830 [Devosia sp.]|nr:hypothetical protein [Devosia sp.]